MICFAPKKSSLLINMGLPTCVKHVAKAMVEFALPIPRHRSRQLAHNPYVDDKVDECNELED